MTSKTLGEFIRAERDKLHVSLRELSKRVGITPPSLSDFELGRRFPSEETMKAIARELRVSVECMKQFDNREYLSDFKRLVESNKELGVAFRSTMEKVKSGKLSLETLAGILDKVKEGEINE